MSQVETYPRDEAVALVRAEFEAGARSVRLRSPLAIGMSEAAVAIAAERAREGRCLVLCPRMLQAQFEAQLSRIDPGASVGRWGSGAALVLAGAGEVDRRAAGAPEERFDAVVVEEHHPEQFPRIRGVLARFPEALVLEVTRMPRPYPGAVEPDAEIDLVDGPAQSLDGPRR